jgi:hypothetical protein
VSREEFERALTALAESLEQATRVTRTREEQIRVDGHAREARRLAAVFVSAGKTGAADAA